MPDCGCNSCWIKVLNASYNILYLFAFNNDILLERKIVYN